MRLIPQNIGMRKFDCETLIPGELSLQKQNDLLDALESSYMALTKSDSSNKSNSPQEKIFKVDLDILTDDSERRRLEKFFTSSKRKMHGYDKVKIREIYQVNIHEMTAAFESTLTPIVEVFHGTSQANCLSILKSGLKIRPPSTASIAGSMFGNGIYGAINSSKSLGYTFGRWGQGGVGESGWLFICKFAMGKIKTVHSGTKNHSGYDSIWAKKGYSLYHDELVVYRNSQVKITHLIECK